MGKSKFGKVSQKSALSEKGSRYMCNHLAFEEAVWHFITNHQMDEMIGNSGDLRRQIDMVHRGFDFESEDLCIDVKVFLQESNAGYGLLRKRFRCSIEQMMGYICGSSETGTDRKRMILLVVGPQGIGIDIKTIIHREGSSLLKKAVGMGLELWVAEVEMERGDGMGLLSYENMTNDMEGGI